MKEVISIPNASKTFKALRSLGYNINSSIADIVDNALTGRVSADTIQIFLRRNKDHQIIARIKDNGKGMTKDELRNAMRIGADANYKAGDLGKFGMGMKTASLSHCNILTVISKTKNKEISGFRWDLAHVKDTGEWSLLELDNDRISLIIEEEDLQLLDQGTIILWDDLSLINSEYNSKKNQKLADNYLYRRTENLKLHLRMVFHRFLDKGNTVARDITLQLNHVNLDAWDPFCRSEEKTSKVLLDSKLSNVYINNYIEPVIIGAYVLPNKEGFSSEKAWKEAKGLLSWNDSQGYYIYRANRLIRFGGWHGTKAKDEHDKLARLSIDIAPELDDEFRITVNKNKVELPEILFQHLKNSVNPTVVKKAKIKYKREPDKSKVNNKFRNNNKVQKVSKDFLSKNGIKTKIKDSIKKNDVVVHNKNGSWLSNKLNEFLKYGNEDNYEIVSDHLDNGQLWKIVCDPYNKFKVIINSSHPFYTIMYKSGINKQVSEAVDALIFSLAFSELYNKSDQNAHLFDTFKTVFSQALEKLVKEKII